MQGLQNNQQYFVVLRLYFGHISVKCDSASVSGVCGTQNNKIQIMAENYLYFCIKLV